MNRFALALSLALAPALVACSTKPASPAETAAALTCPPCGMELPADHELTEIAGKRFAFCSPLCAEKVAASPEKYAQYAVP